MSSGSSTSPQTVNNVSTPPQYVQDQAQKNIGTANYIASQPYPNYQGQLIAGMNPEQTAAAQSANAASTSYQPELGAATNQTNAALGQNPINSGAVMQGNPLNQNSGLALNNQSIGQYMSPYIQQSLQPQLQAAQQNLASQQQQTNAQATQAGAFGDARQGVQNSLNQYYGNQNMAGIEAQGLNTGYNTALQTAQGQQQLGVQEQGVLQNQQNLGLNEQNLQLQGGAQQAALAAQQQAQATQGANTQADVGSLYQANQQQQLNTAYQQYLQQTQYPQQMLNLQESTLTNNPYQTQNQIQLPGANSLTSGLGSFAGLAGSLGTLMGGSGGSSATSPFG